VKPMFKSVLKLLFKRAVTFVSAPSTVQAGSSYTLTWSGDTGASASIILRKGSPADLATVGTIGV
jgi:hypothetical protein